jgi:two-component system, LuxR family, sensor kinase FixL
MVVRFLATLIRSRKSGLHSAAIAFTYVAIYVALDRVSFFQVLPGTCFTPWNPPPAASVALLVICGLRFAPWLFVAGVISDLIVIGCSPGMSTTVATNAIAAIGYTGVAAALRRFAHADQGFPRVADIAHFLLIAGTGTLAVASLAVTALVMMNGLSPGLAYPGIRHYFVGDLTGIVGLLPAVLTIPQAWERWKEVPPATRVIDGGLFVLGLVAALSMVFGVASSKELQFFYLLLLPVIWIGVRHGLAWCAIAISVTQLALISMIAVLDYPRADFLAYQILSIAVAASGLILGAVVTERQRAELYLRQQQAELYRAARLTTAGALGAAVVHEISQPLATLATYAHVCRRLITASPINFELLHKTMAKLESEVQRTGDIVERLRDFLTKSEPRWSPIDLADVTREVVAALADTARSLGVTVRIDARPLAQIAADRTQLEQVLVNLIRNAIEAVGECGDPDKGVWIRLRQVDGESELAVEDNGPGVSAELAERLFKPFETSKERGMGLGLSLSREIVKAHGGRLWRDATVTAGARFVLRLPCDKVEHS